MNSIDSLRARLPASLQAEQQGPVAVLRLKRAHKRNALDDETVIGIETFFNSLPDDVACVLLCGDGEHFSDFATLESDPGEFSYPALVQSAGGDLLLTYTWNRNRISFARIPLARVPK